MIVMVQLYSTGGFEKYINYFPFTLHTHSIHTYSSGLRDIGLYKTQVFALSHYTHYALNLYSTLRLLSYLLVFNIT